MRPIPLKLRKKMSADPFYSKCPVADYHCTKKIDWHHCFIYAGRQVNEKWAILPTCTYHHNNAPKDYLQFLALRRATIEDFDKYPRFDWLRLLKYLNGKYKDYRS